jgi:3-isopropylmalate/(R)-2-methylmalate dehydratase large subunit
MGPSLTFFEKVWRDHVISYLDADTAVLQMDRLLVHEMSCVVGMTALERKGRTPASPGQVYAVIDHAISTQPGRSRDDTRTGEGVHLIRGAREFSHRYGFTFFDADDIRQGIEHVVSPERGIALPGLTLVCADSHTCTNGGVGALAWGIGLSESEQVLATQTLTQAKPKTMRVRFEGKLPQGVYPKDLILALIGQIGANGGIGFAVEFAGSAIRSMPVEGRLTICNMAIEFQAKYGFVPPDDVTIEYLRGREFAPKGDVWRQAEEYWRTLPSDPDATFDAEVIIEVEAIRPQVTWGTSPQQVTGIDGHVPDPAAITDEGTRRLTERALDYMRLSPGTPVEGLPIDAAYIGSCTNARLSDLRIAAQVLRGRRVAAGILAICVPGSTEVRAQAQAEGLDRVFLDAGFEWHEAGCGMCGNGGRGEFADRRVVSTTNRNFEGRQGPKTRTHLASPATVAASALEGRIADPARYIR